MQKELIKAIIQTSKEKLFVINGKEKLRLFVSSAGDVAEYMKGSRSRGYLINEEVIKAWNTLAPVAGDSFKREVNNCINLILNHSSGRALDNYFENGDYSNRIVAAITNRCKKNQKLHDILKNEWNWKELA